MGLKEDFKDLTPSKCLAGGILLAGVYYALLFDSGKNLEVQISTINQEAAATKNRIDEVENALQDKASHEARASAITKELEELLKFFPSDININDFQKDVSALLKKSNNRLIKIQEEKVEGRFPGYVEIGVLLEAEGGFQEMMDFLSALTKMPRMVDIKKLKFSTTEASNDEMSQVRAQMLLTIFSYDAAAEKAAAEAVQGATPQ